MAKNRPLRTSVAGPIKLEETVGGDRRVANLDQRQHVTHHSRNQLAAMADLLVAGEREHGAGVGRIRALGARPLG